MIVLICSSGQCQMCLAVLWLNGSKEESSLSCDVLLSFLIVLQESSHQRSFLLLLVCGCLSTMKHCLCRFCSKVLLQLCLKDKWSHYAVTWHYPPMCSSSFRNTETLLPLCFSGRCPTMVWNQCEGIILTVFLKLFFSQMEWEPCCHQSPKRQIPDSEVIYPLKWLG